MLESVDYKNLNRDYFKLMLIRRMLFSLILMILVVVFYFTNKDKEISNLIYFGAFIGVFVFVISYLSLTKLFFKRKQYLVTDSYLSYKKGILINQLTVVPFSRIQHIEIDDGPFERFFNLSTMSIYTAGDSGKDLKINGLKREKAQEIKELITAYIKDE